MLFTKSKDTGAACTAATFTIFVRIAKFLRRGALVEQQKCETPNPQTMLPALIGPPNVRPDCDYCRISVVLQGVHMPKH
jgi:hypothetical protein